MRVIADLKPLLKHHKDGDIIPVKRFKETMNLKPQDLRLGILIHDTVRNTNTTLQLKHFRELYISEEQFFNRYKPVEITEEMLLEMGFKLITIGYYRLLKGNILIERGFSSSAWIFRIIISKNESIFIQDVEFTHKLQSLYYDMIGEELNISKFLLRN